MPGCLHIERGLDPEGHRPARARRWALRLAGGGLIALAASAFAPAGAATAALAVALALSLLAIVGLDRDRAVARFRLSRRAVAARHYEAWRAWDDELDRWCLLVRPRAARTDDAVTALADARRSLALGPAYHAEHGPDGPFWVFES